jgi:hypothetical protein
MIRYNHPAYGTIYPCGKIALAFLQLKIEKTDFRLPLAQKSPRQIDGGLIRLERK